MSDDTLQIESSSEIDYPAGRFRALWTRGARPDLRAFLDAEPDLDLFGIVEVVQVDQRFRRLAGEAVDAADYFAAVPRLAESPEARFMLVYAEFLLREDLGESPDPAAYARDYPDLADRLRTQLEVHNELDAGGTTLEAPVLEIGNIPIIVPRTPSVPGFEVLEFLGRGGMGVVFKARNVRLGRVVALKMFHPGADAGPKEIARFRAEAETIARLHHPNIVQIHNVFDLDGRPCLELEYVDGGSLAQRIAAAPLSPRDAAAVVETAARAIDAAHRLGVIHRDVKPANILLTVEGVPKLGDFGLAKYLHADAGLTQSEALLGSPCYMAPEQADGALGEVGPAADVYALGVVAYEAVTGRPPFKAATVYATLAQVKTAAPVPPSRLQPGLHPDLETICLKCLHKEPARRYQSAAELADDLTRFLSGETVRARPVSKAEAAWRWCRRKPVLAGLASAVLVLTTLLAVGGWIAFVVVAFERDRAIKAEQEARDDLRQSLINQARANRLTGRAGQRRDSLRSLQEAAEIRPAADIRDEVIACLALHDLDVDKRWKGNPELAFPVEFDPTLEHYVCGVAAGPLQVRRVSDNSVVAEIGPPPGATNSNCGFSPDGRLLAVTYAWGDRGPGEFVVWEIATGRPLLRRPRRTGVGAFAFSQDGRRFACALDDRTIRVIDIATGYELGRAWGLAAEPSAVALSPSADAVAVTSLRENEAIIYRLDTGMVERRLKHPQRLRCMAWSNDGARIAVGCEDRRAYLWDLASRHEPIRLAPHKLEVVRVGFNASGTQVFSAGWDDYTRLFDARNGRELVRAPGQAVRFGGDERLAFREADEYVGVWDVLGSSAFRLMRSVEPDTSADPLMVTDGNRGVDFSPDGRLVAGAGPDGARVWRVDDGRELARVPCGRTAAVTFSLDGDSLVTFGIQGLFAWPIAPAPEPAASLVVGRPRDLHGPAHRTRIHRLCWAPDGRTLIVNDPLPGRVIAIDFEAGAIGREYVRHRGVFGVAASPDGRWIAGGSRQGNGAVVWDATTGKIVHHVDGTRPGATSVEVSFSPDGRWLVAGGQGDYHFYEAGSWNKGPMIRRNKLEGMPGPLAYSPDGRLLAIAPTELSIRVLDARTLKTVATLVSPEANDARALRFSPDGRYLAVAAESIEILLWDLAAIRSELDRFGVAWDQPGPD